MKDKDRVIQIARATKSARPKDSNPAWKNCHHDIVFLLHYIDHLHQIEARYNFLTKDFLSGYDPEHKTYSFYYDGRGELSGQSEEWPDLDDLIDKILAENKHGQ